MTQISKTALSDQKRQLVQKIQTVFFGDMFNISVQNGEPIMTPDTVIEREIKLAGNPQNQYTKDHTNFLLKKEVLTLMEEITRMGNGTIIQLEIKHGLPFLIRIREQAV